MSRQSIRPGETNEVAIGIKDAFYGSADPGVGKTHIAYLPFGFWHYNETNPPGYAGSLRISRTGCCERRRS